MTVATAVQPISVEPITAQADIDNVLMRLRNWNFTIVGKYDFQPYNFGVRNAEGHWIGAIGGETALGWVFIGMLWVDPEERGRGVASKLIKAAETEGLARGCHGSFVDTTDWQAKPFYEKQGYRCFAVMDDFPIGHQRFMLRKALRELTPSMRRALRPEGQDQL